jgi:hypothetical protein
VVGATDPHPDHLPPAHNRFVAPSLNRADRRALHPSSTQRADDLAVSSVGVWVYIGIRNGGRVRLSQEEARQMAAALLEQADPD